MVFVQNGLQRYKLFSKKQGHQLKLFECEEKRDFLIVWLKPNFYIHHLKNGINANPIHYKWAPAYCGINCAQFNS